MDIALKIVSEMITQREYKITEDDDDKLIGTNSEGEQVVVFKQPVLKFNVDRVKEYISLLHKMKMNHCIVIYTDSVTSMTKKLVANSIDIKIELFTQEELQYNITKHRLVPEHIRLPPGEAKEFKEKFGLRHPAILRTDPISRFFAYKRGDVIKITRKTGRGDPFITYRIVKG
jgi:DNA-directed RNA polymerase I, II, and III subunit RPABC1